MGVEPCRDERTCFVLEDATQPGLQVFLDTATYYPVTVTYSDPGPGEPSKVEIAWNEDFEIEVPTEAEEATADEIAGKLFELFIALGSLQAGS